MSNLGNLSDNYHAMIERQNDLLNAATSREEIHDLKDLFLESQFNDCNLEEHLNKNSEIIGWNVTAQK
jgi:hypothetical protein